MLLEFSATNRAHSLPVASAFIVGLAFSTVKSPVIVSPDLEMNREVATTPDLPTIKGEPK